MTEDVTRFTFAAVDEPFPACSAGSHVNVHLPDGLIRSYSLIDWDLDGRRVCVGVKRDLDGRGGSIAVHDLEVGCELQITPPCNNFPLRAGAGPVVLIGGGIGITPLYAMACELGAEGRTFDLHYIVRTRHLAAFDAPARVLGLGARYHLHCDDTDGLCDFRALLSSYPSETDYYVCGPERMLQAVQEASEELDRGTVFFERFAAPPPAAVDETRSPGRAFRVAISSSGQEYDVPTDKSILQVLREAGHDIDYACSEGACGTCVVDVVEGQIDHRDSILTDVEREAQDCLCVCVSRACSPRLVLDL